ncbi:MAG: YbaB/EbfC family nucleoid-associated protein [Fidelibacterota bacterium]|nr:MAG: YbaB/EbfC family nucleoid-associated protein [Candidatus Neomarinimicrobiota bacterium]
MIFPKGNFMTGLLQQAKQVQDKIEELQVELAALRIEGRSGGGMVTAVVNGQQELISIKIDPTLVSEDIEMVEDLVVAAVRQAIEKSKEESQQKVNAVTGGMMSGLNLPEL